MKKSFQIWSAFLQSTYSFHKTTLWQHFQISEIESKNIHLSTKVYPKFVTFAHLIWFSCVHNAIPLMLNQLLSIYSLYLSLVSPHQNYFLLAIAFKPPLTNLYITVFCKILIDWLQLPVDLSLFLSSLHSQRLVATT